MSDVLVVVGEVAGRVLLSDQAVPTEGQPETPCVHATCAENPNVPCVDGPFPFTVALWQEVYHCTHCDGWMHVYDSHAGGCASDRDFHEWRDTGAVTCLVEVTGPSHHADECKRGPSDDYERPCGVSFCTPDAKPDCWHTPIAGVTPLDVPHPMERPIRRVSEDREPTTGELLSWQDVPASSWWGSISEGARL